MGRSIKYFMWGFQHHYQMEVKEYAKKLFGKLSDKLIPNVFLLGILREGDEGHSICVEPEKCDIAVESFKDVDKLANEIHNNDPRKNICHTMAHVHENYHESLKTECLVKSIQEIVDKQFLPLNKISFVSSPVRVNKYDVVVILQFDKLIYDEFDSFERNELKIHEYRKSKVYRSLIEATIDAFLFEAIQPLYKPNQDRKLYGFNTDVNEILRIAGVNFIGTAISAGSDSRSTYDLFNIANYISSLKYEGDSSFGKLIIARDKHPNIDLKIKLSKPIPLRPHRFLRKLLEISSNDFFLYTNGNEILGFGELKGKYDSTKEDLFEVIFLGEQGWQFQHSGKILMNVEYTNPSLPKIKLDRSKFDSTLRRIFGMNESIIKKQWKIINSAIKQKHGTLIIISKNVEKEAQRLKNQSTLIEPIELDDETIKLITSIDGALLFDESGFCHSMGVILDGKASNNGTPSRGARYNSAIRYVDDNKNDSIAIIISEDGMVDLYPDLMPQISKIEILSRLDELEKESNKEKPSYDKYQPIIYWFDSHRFYLQKDICEKLNKIKSELKEKLVMEVSRIYVQTPDFRENPEMDDSYFI